MDVERKPDAAVLHVFVHLFVLCPKACVLQVCAQRLQIMTCCKRMCWRSFRDHYNEVEIAEAS